MCCTLRIKIFLSNAETDPPPQIVIAVNKPPTANHSAPKDISSNLSVNEKKNKLERIINRGSNFTFNTTKIKYNIFHIFPFTILLNSAGATAHYRRKQTAEEYGLKVETEIINANDENVLNLLLKNKSDEIKGGKKKYAPPIIVILPQPLSNQELLYYKKYKYLIRNDRKTKNLLLKVTYFEKLAEIKSRNKVEATDEAANATKVIEKSLSRRYIIDETLAEVFYKNRRDDNQKIKKLRLIN
ncbi:conserved Plasmodium protein, unknown function [Plasmodium ovale curtisi]|uniref:Uncharacterized protein n=1 Tax=Plasmodium ovale curtisi TaxID=864141 RepID=A0A1A8X3W4_PLAOA|nr:conserved Plasmodium protein, unknown function [Plasmodium ovale curtisi]SBS99948.1 conserved Plasmodium protein, unknown function [Plasmodium ovale curtisi]